MALTLVFVGQGSKYNGPPDSTYKHWPPSRRNMRGMKQHTCLLHIPKKRIKQISKRHKKARKNIFPKKVPEVIVSSIFLKSFVIIGAGKAVNKSAASAASPDYVKFRAVIKSAAGAASPN